MPQVVRVEGTVEERTIKSNEMEHGKVYVVVTQGSLSGWGTGTPIIRGGEQGLAALGKNDNYIVCPRATVRELRPGEIVTITGG